MLGLAFNKHGALSSKDDSPSKIGGKEPNYLDLMPDLEEEEDGPSFKLLNVNTEQSCPEVPGEDESDLVGDGFFDKLMTSNKPTEDSA